MVFPEAPRARQAGRRYRSGASGAAASSSSRCAPARRSFPCAVVAATAACPVPGPLAAAGAAIALADRVLPTDRPERVRSDAAADRRLVLEVADAVRDQLQAKVHENLIRRERTDR